MLKKINYRILLLCILIICVMFSACSVESEKSNRNKELFINEDQSCFSDFEVSENRVNFKCHICVENQTHEAQLACLLGSFEEDVKTGLVKEETLLASHQDVSNDVLFLLQPGTNDFDLNFVGTFNGNILKHDRLLPDISIIKVVQKN